MSAAPPLRIAYFTEWSPHDETGVLRKLIGQVETWRALGAEAEIFALATQRETPPALGFASVGKVIGAVHQRTLEKYPAARLGYFNKMLSVRRVKRAIRAFAPDVIYYRQNGPWYPGLGSILSLAPTVVEINTDEEAESKLWGKAFATLYSATQHRVLSRLAGFVSVTGELAARYRPLGKPIAVIANSFWGAAPPAPPPTTHAEPVFVFVGSPLTGGESWHGTDKLFPLAAALPDSRFHIVGLERGDFPDHAVPPNVEFHGYCSASELSAIVAGSDIGIGTLAFHRKAMSEGCPLKVREYLMHRLPVVIGYTEAQDELNTADYVLSIGNAPDNIEQNIDAIARFAAKWKNSRVDADLTYLTAAAIESRRLAFLREVAGRS